MKHQSFSIYYVFNKTNKYNVGKTSIVSRYCKNIFNEHHINKIGGAYQKKKLY